MKAKITQYLSEIVSLAVMLLMVVALVAAQAGAMPQAGSALDADMADEPSAIVIQEPIEPVQDVEIDVLQFSIEMHFDDATVHGLASEWSAALGAQLQLRRRQAGQD